MRETTSRETIGVMRHIAVALLAGQISGCSWVLMQKPEESYADDTQPQCSGELCFPTDEACDARRARTGIELACQERE